MQLGRDPMGEDLRDRRPRDDPRAQACEVARARTKLGIAIAAKRPIMATTIMISTRVKPALRTVLVVFILFFLNYSVNKTTSGFQ